ncbi:MAG: branched-chain amino acid ABC transporter permease [Nitrospinota bacterium]|nr:MAG: branched-chain amino acid ABC transporter permease [Nitrospinota bacterium]
MFKRSSPELRQALLLLVPVLFAAIPLLSEPFYTRLFTRIMIYAIVAISLDLILGYGGMVSFGHAAFFGVGAYTVGILSYHGVESGWIAWPLATLLAAGVAFVIGAISLRTSGVYFIMITLAFAQMLYYFFFSLEGYGGDDGLPLWSRNTFGGLIDIENHTVFYYVVFGILGLILFVSHRLVHSRFGMVIRGIRENERRMNSLGFPTFWYKLVCFVIAGGIAGLAGALIANHTLYVSPTLMHWTRSGDIIVMVILGGMGSLIGPLLGATTLLLAEDILSSFTEHWMILLGPLLVLMVLFAKGGIYGLLMGGKKR